MTPAAIIMMLVAMLVIWGGLALAIMNLRRHPEAEYETADERIQFRDL
jgi:hypothetical protein